MEALVQRKLSLVATFLWRGLKFKRGYGPLFPPPMAPYFRRLWPPISAVYGPLFPPPMDGGASETSCRRRTNLKEANQKSEFLKVITTYMFMAYNPQRQRSTVLR